jgi:hypothetical protein
VHSNTGSLPPEAVPGYAPGSDPVVARHDEHVIARDDERVLDRTDEFSTGRLDEPLRDRPARETAAGTPLEDLVDRAQPGDVLGIETGGETTGLGDTARDEDERREDAEETNRQILEDQRRNRKE